MKSADIHHAKQVFSQSRDALDQIKNLVKTYAHFDRNRSHSNMAQILIAILDWHKVFKYDIEAQMRSIALYNPANYDVYYEFTQGLERSYAMQVLKLKEINRGFLEGFSVAYLMSNQV